MLNQKFNFKRAIGIEPRLKNINKGIYARNFYSIDTKVKFKQGSIASAKKLTGGQTFDIVLNLGTLHHVSSTPDSIKSLCKLSKDVLIIDSMVVPAPRKDKVELLRYLNLKDLVYSGEEKIWAIAAYKFESDYYDGSTSGAKIVNVPEEKLIEMSIKTENFEIISQSSPESRYYNKKMQRLRGVKEALVVSRKLYEIRNENDWEGKIYEHEFLQLTVKVDPVILIKWLRKINRNEDAKRLNLHVKKSSRFNFIRMEILILFSKFPTNKFLRYIVKKLEKSSMKIELLQNISRAPLDKIYLELGKFYISQGLLQEANEYLESIIDRPGADWRSFYRSCYLLSCVKSKQKKLTESYEFLNLVKISNSNWPAINCRHVLEKL
jgi:hypothetical protein